MNGLSWDVLLLAVLLAANRLGVPATYHRPAAFWAIQALDGAVAVAVAVWGLPGLSGYPSVSWLIAGLLVFHIFQNVALRNGALHKRALEATERERLKKIRAIDAAPERTDPPEP